MRGSPVGSIGVRNMGCTATFDEAASNLSGNYWLLPGKPCHLLWQESEWQPVVQRKAPLAFGIQYTHAAPLLLSTCRTVFGKNRACSHVPFRGAVVDRSPQGCRRAEGLGSGRRTPGWEASFIPPVIAESLRPLVLSCSCPRLPTPREGRKPVASTLTPRALFLNLTVQADVSEQKVMVYASIAWRSCETAVDLFTFLLLGTSRGEYHAC